MNKKSVLKYLIIVLLLFFAFVNFISLMDEILSGYLTNPSEWKSFIFVSIDLTISIVALVGVWKLKKWGYGPLIAMATFGIILSILYLPSNVSGNFLDKMGNLPLSLYMGLLTLVLYIITMQMQITLPDKKNGTSQNNNR